MPFGVPGFYGHKAICLLWPASVKGGGVKNGVLLGFWQGVYLDDLDGYLTHGSNKRIFYKIFLRAEDIEEGPLVKMLLEAVRHDEEERRKRR
jgi:hypothetical protein